MQVAAEQQAANVPVHDVPVPSTATYTDAQKEAAMDVDTANHPIGEAHSAGKRKAEDEGQAEGPKKARVGTSPITHIWLGCCPDLHACLQKQKCHLRGETLRLQ